MNREKLFKFVEVLKEFREHAPDVTSNIMNKRSHFYFVKSGYSFLFYMDKRISIMFAGVYYHRKNRYSYIKLENGDYLKFSDTGVYLDLGIGGFVLIYNPSDLDKDEYFNNMVQYDIPFSPQEMEVLYEVLRANEDTPEITIHLDKFK